MKSSLILLSFLFGSLFGYSQTSSGNRFWVAYMENLPLFANDDPVFIISVDASVETSVTISRPANGWSQTYTAAANTLTNITLPSEIFYTIGEQVVDDFGILIETDNLVKVSAIHNRAYFSESTAVLPESTIGNEYILSAFVDASGASPSELVLVATQNNTEVEIIPAATTTMGNSVGIPFTILLNEGQTYQVKAEQDLTGTAIRSLGGEKIAVFGGAQQANVSICNGADNHIYEQNWPISLWDDLFYFVPFKDQGGDVLQIVAAADNTTIFFDCSEITTLDQGAYYSGRLSDPTVITATGNVAIMQLNESQSCNASGIGDPTMVQVSPIQYKTTQTRFFSNGNINGLGFAYFSKHLVNIISKTAEVGNVQLDGNPIENEFEVFTADPTWSYAQIQLNSTGIHDITSSTPFQAYSYGFGDFDAYAHALGYDMVQEEEFACLDIEIEGLFCVDSILTLSTSSNLEIVEWDWTFGDGGTSNAATPNYAYANAGSYMVTLDVILADGSMTSTSLAIQVLDCSDEPCQDLAPIDILISNQTCVDSIISFDVGTVASVIEFMWTFSTGQTFNVIAPDLVFDAPGVYSATLFAIDVDGCEYETTEDFEVIICEEEPCQDLPNIEILAAGELCVNSAISFGFSTTANLVSTVWELDTGESSNQPNFSFTPNQAGNYLLSFFAEDNDGCTYLEEVLVFVEDCSPDCDADLLIEVEGLFCDSTLLDFSLLLEQQAGSANATIVSAIWDISNGSTFNTDQFSTTFLAAGTYDVFVLAEADDGCIYSEELLLEISSCIPEDICGLDFPNAFSPNEDGFNDEFRAYFECLPLDFDLQIFSRWGELVFETDDPSGFWNGRFKNEPLGVGVYVWVAEYSNSVGETVQIYGDVMLLR